MADEKLGEEDKSFSEAFNEADGGDGEPAAAGTHNPAPEEEAGSQDESHLASDPVNHDASNDDPEPPASASMDEPAEVDQTSEAEPTAESIAADIAALEDQKKKLVNDVNSMRGRKASLERTLSEMETDPSPTNEDEEDSPVTGVFKSADFEEVRNLYPDLAESLEKTLSPAIEKLAEENGRLKREVGVLSGDRETNAGLAEQQIVLDVFPDYETMIHTQGFADWYNQSPSYVQGAVQNNGDFIKNGAEVVDILRDFQSWEKAQSGDEPQPEPSAQADPTKIQKQRQARSDAADGPSPKNGGPANDRVPDDFSAAFKAASK